MSTRFPLVTAHTGCMGTPENSLESVAKAIALNADIVEDDVRVTKDGLPVLAHDDRLRVAEGVELQLSHVGRDELMAVRRAHGERSFCLLEEMLRLVKPTGKVANLDLKQDECIEPVAALVDRLGMRDQVFLSGCGPQRARKANARAPELRKLLNVDPAYFATSAAEGIRRNCEAALAASCFGLNFNYRLVDEAVMAYAATQALPVYVWTLNDEAEMERFVQLGVESITTRQVAALMQLKKRRHTP